MTVTAELKSSLLAARQFGGQLARGQTTVLRVLARAAVNAPGRVLGMLVTLGLSAAIMFNALVLQTGSHPAPLFTSIVVPRALAEQLPLPPVRPAAASQQNEAAARRDVMIRELQAELGKRGFFEGAADGKASPRLTDAIKDFQELVGLPVNGEPGEALLNRVKIARVRMKDQILQMLKPAQAEAGGAKTIVMAQRALNKVGFGPLKEDGDFGSGTRSALEKFERSRKLPVTGALQPRVLRELAAASGVAVE